MFSWIIAVADLIVCLSYFSIPLEIVILWYRKNLHISYFTSDSKSGFTVKLLVGLFVAFILLCGITHLLAFCAYMDLHMNTADLVFKTLCAVVSVITASVLALMLPNILHTLKEVELTKRGLPEEALTRYENIMRYSLDVISTHESVSGSCSFLSVSPSVYRLLGYSVEELLGRPLFDFVSRKDYIRVVHEFNSIVKGHQHALNAGVVDLQYHEDTTTTIEYRLKCKNGTRKLVETGVSIGIEGQGTVLILVTRDVSERKAQETERRERENLEMSMAVRQQYISSIAHDLKTPISTFQLALELLGNTEIDEEQAVLVAQAKVATEFMSVTIFQAMDFARMAADGTMKSLVPRRMTTNVRGLVDKCASVLDGYPKQVPINFVVSAEIAPEILVDGDWIWQMLINLFTNACKFTTSGSIGLKISIARPPHGLPHFAPLEVHEPGEKTSKEVVAPVFLPGALLGGFLQPDVVKDRELLLFEIKDTGVGIPDAKKNSLFQAFGQAQHFQSQGTGLGLYSVAQKALKLGGTYGLLDNHPSGSNFFFAVPYLPEEDIMNMQDMHRFAGVACTPNLSLSSEIGLNSPRDRSGKGKFFKDISIQIEPGSSLVSPYLKNSNLHMLTHKKDKIRVGKETIINELPKSDGSVRFQLPAKNCDIQVEENDTEVSSPFENREAILIIDDTKSARMLIAKALDWWNFEAVHASNGLEGLEAMKKRNFALVITDLQMPVLDGLECVKRFRAWESENRQLSSKRQIILTTSANCENSDLDLCIDSGADGFLSKPISLALLKTVVLTYSKEGQLSKSLRDFRIYNRTFRIYSAQSNPREISVQSKREIKGNASSNSVKKDVHSSESHSVSNETSHDEELTGNMLKEKWGCEVAEQTKNKVVAGTTLRDAILARRSGR